jgi:ribosomal protein S18 acetylase RimI-like enzyme
VTLLEASNMNVHLTPVAPADSRAAVLATLAAAFVSDPAVRALYPADADYDAHFPGFAEALGGRAFDAGIVDTYPAGLGAALWLPPGVEPDGAQMEAHLAATIPAERLAALAEGFAMQAALHPHEPHWYLPWIGVRPEAQGAGIGSILLRQGLARADSEEMPAYLEATDPRNAMLYARHGFEVTGIVLAPGYPQIITMWRPARRAG